MRRPRIEETRRFSSPLGDSPTRQSDESSSDKLRPYSLPPNPRSVSESLRSKDHSVRFRDDPKATSVATPIHSEDEESIAGSDITTSSDVSSRRKRRQRRPRKSSKFALAQPAPQLRTKQRRLVQFRPRLLLQLQELGERRAIPAFDVVPSSHVAGTLIIPALAKRFPRMFRAKPDLGHDDLLLMRSEDYKDASSASSQTSDDASDDMGRRDALAVVTTKPQQGHDTADIVTSDGVTWAINAISNGSYEVVKQNGESSPVTGRWVRRLTPARTNSSSSEVPQQGSTPATEQRWTFSILNPAARRHPVMGVLTPTSLEVYDNYTTMSSASSRYPPTKAFGSTAASEQAPTAPATKEERSTMAVTEEHKVLMMASSIWINLRQQGWPATANPKFSRALSHYRNSVGEAPRRSMTFPEPREGSSDAAKKEAADARRRSKSASAAALSAGSVTRSSSIPRSILKSQPVERVPDVEAEEQNQDGEKEDGAQGPSRNPVVRVAHWLKKCFE
ncbi:hypothetical protein K4F52_001397 [Lecanicillium sp. MT-2017a]|nr:hypothetical protein K4F52_001397 [Lecanicillium sp. MT-2017a]